MGAVAGVSAGAGLLASAASNVVNAEGTNAADQAQSQILAEQASMGQVAATETNANSIAQLTSTLGNIDTVRAAGHDNPASPTGMALRETTESNANQNRAINVGNILTQSELDTSESNYMKQAGQFALTQGWLGAGATAAKGIGATNFSTFGFPTVAA